MTVDSPCIDVCKLDETRSHCIGCLRTLDEIRMWKSMSDGQRRLVLHHVERRRRAALESCRQAPDASA